MNAVLPHLRSHHPWIFRHFPLKMGFLALLIATALFVFHPIQAATNASLSVSWTSAEGSCAASYMNVQWGFTATTADRMDGTTGLDYIVMVAYDGNGQAIASDYRRIEVSTSITSGWGTGLDDLNTIAARPITIVMYDTGYDASVIYGDDTQAQADYAAGFLVLAEITFDPGTDGNLAAVCDSLPLLAGRSGSKSKSLPYTGIYLMPDAQQAPYLAIPAADGVAPCGVFDVNGWGRKYVGLADFPACTPPDLTVRCLNADREWVADSVSDIYLRSDGAELDFTASQHGICALFPTGGS